MKINNSRYCLLNKVAYIYISIRYNDKKHKIMSNLNSYYNVAGSSSNYAEGLEIAKQEGYTHLYRWVDSDLGWTFFAKSYDEACAEAVELYLQERGRSVSKTMTKEEAEGFYSEYVDIIEIEDEISSL